jgi:hypothetical protein
LRKLRILSGLRLMGDVTGIPDMRFVVQQWSYRMLLPPPPFQFTVGDPSVGRRSESAWLAGFG